MNNRTKLSFVALALIATALLPLQAQEMPVRDTVSGSVRFIVDRFDPEHAYGIEFAEVDSLARVFRATDDPLFHITDITVTGWASPEGTTEHNKMLSEKRAQTAWELIGDKIPANGVTPRIIAAGENWDRLLVYLDKSGDPSYADAARLIRNTPKWVITSGKITGSRKKSVQALDDGRTWNRMLDDLFPHLRLAVVEIAFECSEGSTLISEVRRVARTYDEGFDTGYDDYNAGVPARIDGTIYLGPDWNRGYDAGYETARRVDSVRDSLDRKIRVLRDSVASLAARPLVVPCKKQEKAIARMVKAAADTVGRRPLFAIGTNALYDLAIMPSVNLEIPIRNKVSIYGDHVFPWWVMRKNASALENLHTKAGVRIWLGDRSQYKPLHGWWIGINGGAATGDFEPNHKGYQWEAFGASLEGGYQFDLGHDWRLGLGLDLGYYRYRYDYYEGYRNDRYLVWQREGKGNWFGPTAVHVDIKYLIYYKYRRKVK